MQLLFLELISLNMITEIYKEVHFVHAKRGEIYETAFVF